MKDFINHCLKKDPKQRSNVYELLNHWFITGKDEKLHWKLGITKSDL